VLINIYNKLSQIERKKALLMSKLSLEDEKQKTSSDQVILKHSDSLTATICTRFQLGFNNNDSTCLERHNIQVNFGGPNVQSLVNFFETSGCYLIENGLFSL